MLTGGIDYKQVPRLGEITALHGPSEPQKEAYQLAILTALGVET